jgi:hypothetical protein
LLFAAAAPAAAADPGETAQRVVEGTNAFRKAQALDAVNVNEALEAAARQFARYMAKTGKYGHTADGRQPSERAAAHGYEYCIVSENIAYQFRSPGYPSASVLAEQFVEGWKHSPEHRKYMVDPAVTQTGVGVAQGEGGRYFAVQMFGRPKDAAIHFEVRNRSGAKVEYRVGERAFTLGPRVSRTHMVCRPAEISIKHPPQGKPFSAHVADGARYTVTAERAVQLR